MTNAMQWAIGIFISIIIFFFVMALLIQIGEKNRFEQNMECIKAGGEYKSVITANGNSQLLCVKN